MSNMLTSYEVTERTGITYRELDNWVRAGILPVAALGHHGRSYSSIHIPGTTPGGSGYSRYFTEQTTRIARLLKLLRPHFNLPTLGAFYAGLDALKDPWPKQLWFSADGTVHKRRPRRHATAVCLDLTIAEPEESQVA